MMRSFFILVFFCPLLITAQQVIPLYEGAIPNSRPVPDSEQVVPGSGSIRISRITVPTLTVFEPEMWKRSGTAMVICPGGGYIREAIGHEGYDVAKKLNESGITCFVLKYRLPNDSSMPDKTIGPLQDAQRALQYVRAHAADWKLHRNRIGIMGFSAGGHLASTLGTHYKKSLLPGKNKVSLRPDFMILGYPVINLSDSLMHEGSRNNLLGKNPAPQKIELYSNDLQVNKKTPPTFLVHARDDKTVSVRNSVRFYEALRKNKVPAELYLYEKGGHGFGLNNPTSDVKWIDLAVQWLVREGLLIPFK